MQRCLSNPEVLKLMTEAVRGWMAKNPKAMIFSVSQNDVLMFCECDQCKAIEARYGGKDSGIYLWFVNQIAEAVEKDYPDKLIDTLAYTVYRRAARWGSCRGRTCGCDCSDLGVRGASV